MGRPGEVAFLLALFVLLGTLHGTRAQYDDYGFEDYDESDYDYDDDDGGEEADYQEEDADGSEDTVDRDDWGSPPYPQVAS